MSIQPDKHGAVKEPALTPPSITQLLHLKRSGPEPLYYQLAQSLEQAVDSGLIPHGSKILPATQIACELRVSVATVRKAWAYLEHKGLLTRKRKMGTFIR